MNQTPQTRTLTQTLLNERVAVFMLAGLCLVLSVCYTYFLARSFQHAYSRQAIAEQANILRAEVATLETEYNLALSNSLTSEVAKKRGFLDAAPVLAYVERLPEASDSRPGELALQTVR